MLMEQKQGSAWRMTDESKTEGRKPIKRSPQKLFRYYFNYINYWQQGHLL